MRELTLRQIPLSNDLKAALVAAGLPVDDLDDPGRHYFECRGLDGVLIGFSGLEECGPDLLVRSMVILPEFRSRGYGRELALATIARTSSSAGIYLATTTAAAFFEALGFETVTRDNVPKAILSTRQLSGICPASATIMKLNRTPT
ncbi:GCN5-related N-acetyltransferase protein [Rhizobium phaseoli]|uniref:arsenic resistance N-acetyltransferase ArsN2 n=1 Tax=Rhizobium phaseoli TaxID=396 RepID=UPI0007EB8C05|nr:arsenic resistance N-acetyltransferase ArsN2 [Rhizobium phaseoli]ANL66844.1 GCN5-related N-acetyltransferase protein [Rhizobium phaseoli]ANL73252.1 GCN5-related N-acetyltransferase protein [Rhizobium phaseoli]ANL79657.1 GCN5-related N-acetyltransferase protein [Rhizobium phaseoli]